MLNMEVSVMQAVTGLVRAGLRWLWLAHLSNKTKEINANLTEISIHFDLM